MALAYASRQFGVVRSLVTLRDFRGTSQTSRGFSSSADGQQSAFLRYLTGRKGLALATGALGVFLYWSEERETIKARHLTAAISTLESGAKLYASGPGDQLLPLEDRLVDLLQPYVCSMSHVDVVHGPGGSGKSHELRRASSAVPSGAVLVDLQRGGDVGSRVLQVLTGAANRSFAQRLRDVLQGGREAHGLKLLEAAAARYLAAHERYPVVTFDHVDPEKLGLRDPNSPLLRLGRRDDAESPALRTVLALDDAGLETLQRDADPETSFRIVALRDKPRNEATELLIRHRFPRELAEAVIALVGGRVGHLQDAISYWASSPRWLSPMRPSEQGEQDRAASMAAHFSEIKKIIFWDLDKRLRISAGIALWPAATGDAPVHHQSPTDEDAVRIVDLLGTIQLQPLPATAARAAIGEARFLQLLQAQVLGFEPQDGPLHKRAKDERVTFGSPAMQQYFSERLAEEAQAVTLPVQRSTKSWTSYLFGGS